MDLYVAFIDTPFHEIGHVQSAALSLISSFFWLLDAVLYICADADIFDVVVSVDALDIDHPLILAPQDDYEDEDDITMTRCSGP